MKKIDYIIIGICIILLCGCKEEKNVKSFNYSTHWSLTHFDPHHIESQFSLQTIGQVYESLVGIDENFQISESRGLAYSWTQKAANEWVFYLREDVRFHDGSLLQASDVYASWRRAKKAPFGPVIAKDIVNIEITDNFTLTFYTDKYVIGFLEKMRALLIMDSEWIKKHNAEDVVSPDDTIEKYTVRNANGTGLYTLSSISPNSHLVFEKNNNYWDIRYDDQVIDLIHYQTIDNEINRFDALKATQVHAAFPLNLLKWELFEDAVHDLSNMHKQYYIEKSPVFIGLDQHRNTLIGAEKGAQSNPFKDKRVREAINLAIDIEYINTILTHDFGQMLGILSMDLMMFHPKEDQALNMPYAYDIEQAKQLLKDAGYENGFSFRLDCPNSRARRETQLCEMVVNMLNEINITVDLQLYELAEYHKLIIEDKNTSAYLFWISEHITPTNVEVIESFLAYPDERENMGNYNIGHYKNLGISSIVKQLRTIDDEEIIFELVKNAHRFVKNDFGYVPLLAFPIYVGVNEKYSMPMSKDGNMELGYIRRIMD